jgi:error-prone DNA polymerase
VERPVEEDDLCAWAERAAQPLNEELARVAEEAPLAVMNEHERVHADYSGTSLTLARHTMSLLRPGLPDCWRASDLRTAPDGTRIRTAGNVICRQRPGTAKGVVFISLEDETGISNSIVQSWLFEHQRLLITQEPFLIIQGRVQQKDGTTHILAEQIEALRVEGMVGAASHDFH